MYKIKLCGVSIGQNWQPFHLSFDIHAIEEKCYSTIQDHFTHLEDEIPWHVPIKDQGIWLTLKICSPQGILLSYSWVIFSLMDQEREERFKILYKETIGGPKRRQCYAGKIVLKKSCIPLLKKKYSIIVLEFFFFSTIQHYGEDFMIERSLKLLWERGESCKESEERNLLVEDFLAPFLK